MIPCLGACAAGACSHCQTHTLLNVRWEQIDVKTTATEKETWRRGLGSSAASAVGVVEGEICCAHITSSAAPAYQPEFFATSETYRTNSSSLRLSPPRAPFAAVANHRPQLNPLFQGRDESCLSFRLPQTAHCVHHSSRGRVCPGVAQGWWRWPRKASQGIHCEQPRWFCSLGSGAVAAAAAPDGESEARREHR